MRTFGVGDPQGWKFWDSVGIPVTVTRRLTSCLFLFLASPFFLAFGIGFFDVFVGLLRRMFFDKSEASTIMPRYE